jgi:hypothetical protein
LFKGVPASALGLLLSLGVLMISLGTSAYPDKWRQIFDAFEAIG